MDISKLREPLAALQHIIWVHWMEYLFSIGIYNADGSYTIPAEKVERWKRQMHTEYIDLPDHEKDSDREQADRIIFFLKEIK